MKRSELWNHFKGVCWKLMKAKQAQEKEQELSSRYA